jgi:uncharacterized protein YkwD
LTKPTRGVFFILQLTLLQRHRLLPNTNAFLNVKFFISTCAALALATVATAQVVRVTVPGITSIQKDLLAAVNNVRAQNGKQPLCLNVKLTKASQEHSYDMGTGGWVGSVGTTDSTPTTRAVARGFNSTGVAELVGAGYANAAIAIKDWSSPAYSMFILGDYEYMGARYALNSAQTYTTFWVLDFDNQAVGEVCA